MNRPILAIAVPFSGTDLLFATLEALGLPGETIQSHELFISAADFYYNVAAQARLPEDAPAYQMLAAVKPGHFLPGYFFYSRAGASLLAELNFKKIVMVRDPRDIAQSQLSAAAQTAHPWHSFFQNLPDEISRLQACLGGFSFNPQDLPAVNKESLYKELSYYQPWTTEPDTLVVRYEDLILPGATEAGAVDELVNLDTLAHISNWLGLTRSKAELVAVAAELTSRILANQAQVKVGAWQESFSAEMLPVYRKTIGSLLRKFDYVDSGDTNWSFQQPKHRVALISQPKAGTHLLDKALTELGLQLATGFTPGDLEQSGTSDTRLHDLFRGLQPGEYFMTHLHYNGKTAQILAELGYKKIIIIRDPHDVAVSLIRLVGSMQHHYTNFFESLENDDTRLLDAIRGVLPIGLANTSEIFEGIVAWLKEPDCLLVRFEDLIGTSGQGDKNRQIETLQAICRHLEIELDTRQLNEAAGHVFDRKSVTFREGQIGSWKKHFKPVHHQALNKLLDDSIEQFGYKRYFEEAITPAIPVPQAQTQTQSQNPSYDPQAVCEYPVMAITVPGAGVFLLDLILDEIGLGRQKSFLRWAYPADSAVPEENQITLDRVIWNLNSSQQFENLLEKATPNRYLLGYFPFKEKWSEVAADKRFKKIVLVRNRPDTVVALARQMFYRTAQVNPFIAKYFRNLPEDESRYWATIQGLTPGQTGDPTIFLASNQEFFDNLAGWSSQPDTLVVCYESLVGEAGGSSTAVQLTTIRAICHFLELEVGESSLIAILERLKRRNTPLLLDGSIGQGKEHLTQAQIEALNMEDKDKTANGVETLSPDEAANKIETFNPSETGNEIKTAGNFTGERYLPSENGQIKYEHLHRYALCEELVRDKIVLDVASGEGYGTAILAKSARQVIGVDLDFQTVQISRRLYGQGDRPNLNFVAGSCTAIPLQSQSVDVVTSFETIEHHARHFEMLGEIKRVLKPGGRLVISSPNRLVYSDATGYSNPYHVKELYFEEFENVLKTFFKHVTFYGQRIASGSMVFSLQETTSTPASTLKAYSGGFTDLANRVSALKNPVYFIAVCTDTLPGSSESFDLNSLYLDSEDELENQWKLQIALLQKELTDSHLNISKYKVEFENQQKSLEILQTGHTEHTRALEWLGATNTDLNEKLAASTGLNAQLAVAEVQLEEARAQFQAAEVIRESERLTLQTALEETQHKFKTLQTAFDATQQNLQVLQTVFDKTQHKLQALQTVFDATQLKLKAIENSRSFRLTTFVSTKFAVLRKRLHF